METVNNIAAAASKAIWGEPATEGTEKTSTGVNGNEPHGEEPLSGVKGDVEKGEPYDKGNLEPETVATDEVIETTKVLPLRPAGDKATATSDEPDNLTDKVEKALPSLPSTSTPTAPTHTEDKLVKPTPFVAAMKGESTTESPVEEQKVENSKPTEEKLGAVADTAAVQGIGGKRLDEETLPAAYGGATIPVEKKEAESEAPAVPSKVSSEDASTDSKDGKEKLSLKDKIKAKLHHKH